jgi:hypothetical protein
LLTTVLLFSWLSPSHAAFEIVQVREIPSTQTDWSTVQSDDPNTNLPLSFNQFPPDPGLKLENVIITVSWWYYSVINMTFRTPGTITVTTTGSLGVHDPTDQPLITVFPLFTHTQSKTVTSVDPSHPQNFQFVQFPPNFIQGPQVVLTAGTDNLSPYIGNGFIDFPIGARAATTFTDTSGNGFGQSQTFVATVLTLEYIYIPEPASVVLLALGCGTLFLTRPFLRRSSPLLTDH